MHVFGCHPKTVLCNISRENWRFGRHIDFFLEWHVKVRYNVKKLLFLSFFHLKPIIGFFDRFQYFTGVFEKC